MDADGEEGAKVQAGGVIVGGLNSGAKKKATQGQSRMEALMEQYQKQTANHHKKTEQQLAAQTGPDASLRMNLNKSWKTKIQRSLRRGWRNFTKYVDCICNGSNDDEQDRLDAAPIVLGGYHRKIAERVGGVTV